MAGPLNGLGSGQTIPLSNTFQPGHNNDQVRPDDNKKAQDNVVQARGSQAASSQKSETQNFSATRRASNDDSGSQKRGSLLDITV